MHGGQGPGFTFWWPCLADRSSGSPSTWDFREAKKRVLGKVNIAEPALRFWAPSASHPALLLWSKAEFPVGEMGT